MNALYFENIIIISRRLTQFQCECPEQSKETLLFSYFPLGWLWFSEVYKLDRTIHFTLIKCSYDVFLFFSRVLQLEILYCTQVVKTILLKVSISYIILRFPLVMPGNSKFMTALILFKVRRSSNGKNPPTCAVIM